MLAAVVGLIAGIAIGILICIGMFTEALDGLFQAVFGG